jgi:hypothetical protein
MKRYLQKFLLGILTTSYFASCVPDYHDHKNIVEKYVIEDCIEETFEEANEKNDDETEVEEIFNVPDFKLNNYLRSVNELASVLDIVSYQEVIETIKTPYEAQKLIQAYRKRNGACLETRGIINLENSFKRVHEEKVCIDCTEAFMIAAATLSDNGYLPLRLEVRRTEKEMNILEPASLVGHALFLYKKEGLFGFIDDTMISKAEFQTIEEIVEHIRIKYNQSYQSYRMINVNDLNPDWINNVSNGILSEENFETLRSD